MRRTVIVTPAKDDPQRLTIDPPTLEIGPDDFVDWEFRGTNPLFLPTIEFQTHLGPFQYMQVSSSTSVQALGNMGVDGSFPYTAMLLDSTGMAASSGKGGEILVVNPTQARNRSPIAVVHFDLSAKPPLLVGPQNLQLFHGGTAVWDVHGLPEGFFISFLFNLPINLSRLSQEVQSGFFESLAVKRRAGKDTPGRVQVLGVNFSPPPMPNGGEMDTIDYRIVVRDSNGSVFMTSPDPIIDNLGPPASPPIVYNRTARGPQRRRP